MVKTALSQYIHVCNNNNNNSNDNNEIKNQEAERGQGKSGKQAQTVWARGREAAHHKGIHSQNERRRRRQEEEVVFREVGSG
jgi:hypothetical protein